MINRFTVLYSNRLLKSSPTLTTEAADILLERGLKRVDDEGMIIDKKINISSYSAFGS